MADERHSKDTVTPRLNHPGTVDRCPCDQPRSIAINRGNIVCHQLPTTNYQLQAES